MATKTDHVTLRDGSKRLAEPRPTPPDRATPGPREADSGTSLFGGRYGDPSTVGHYDVAQKVFATEHGNPSPRELAQAGNDPGGGRHVEPGDKLESGVPSPID
jgi:hypothetical protein